jgi:transcriptional regulator with XRE-family HTH domain
VNGSRDTRSTSRTTPSAAGARGGERGRASVDEDLEDARLHERELLYGEAVEHLRALMIDLHLTQREVAKRLELPEPRVSRILSGRENLTLKTLADMGWATGLRFEVVAVPLDDVSTTPAAGDPPPPRWLLKHAQLVARRVRDGIAQRS